MPINKITALLGPTNTGKTFQAIETMLSFQSGMIGFPLRLLAREVYDKVVKKIDKNKVALITGEEKIIPSNAKYYLCTVESMPVDKNLECEVLIVGGGLAGLSLAYQLAQQGQNFILIESKRIGECASGINGGFCSPGWSVDSDTLSRQVGCEHAKNFYNISIEGLNWVRSFRGRTGFESMDFRAGTLGLSLLKSEAAARADFLKRDLTFQKEYQFISKKELIDFVDSPAYQSGILSKSGFSFNPLNFLIGLKTKPK